MDLPRHIVIAGAGLVGSLLAVMLGRRGYQVSVYEKRPDMRTHEMSVGRSINLALAERGIDALKRAGLFDAVSKLLIPMRGRMLHHLDGRLEFSPYGQKPEEVINSVSRGELNCLMMTEAETHPQVDIYFEQQCEHIDIENKALRVTDLRNNQTREVEFEVIIGTDGAGSIVRSAIMQNIDGRCDIDMLDHDYKELCIPAGPGDSWQMEKEALHIWPRGGYMLIALPNLDGSYTVTLFLPSKGRPSFESLQDQTSVSEFFEAQFPDAVELIPNLGREFFENPTGELGTIRCWPWSAKGNALIMGDASHAIVPFHGQGMNAGFEDCAELIRLLDEHDDDWPVVMPEFERLRKPNADAIADMALENYIIMRESVAEETFQLKKEVGFELEKRFPDHFIPRYSMVMFHTLPYADALNRGNVQAGILGELCENKTSLDQVDFELAEQLVRDRLAPVYQKT